jgi:hypothetical protein
MPGEGVRLAVHDGVAQSPRAAQKASGALRQRA